MDTVAVRLMVRATAAAQFVLLFAMRLHKSPHFLEEYRARKASVELSFQRSVTVSQILRKIASFFRRRAGRRIDRLNDLLRRERAIWLSEPVAASFASF